MLQIPAATAHRVVDPTGCGDAYRAGLIYGWTHGMDMATTGRIASLMGALKIENLGPQNQRFTFEQFAEQFRQQFGYALK
jgi:adenosine kinase